MKISRRVKTGCALALAALLALPCVNLMQTKAAGPIIEDRKCELTISVEAGVFGEDEGKDDFKGMTVPVKVYKTADVNVSGSFTPAEAFADMDFNVGMNSETNAETWRTLAEEAVEKLKADPALKSAGEGAITEGAPAVIENLDVGMYLVVPENTLNENASVEYVFTPYLTALPSSEYTLTGAGRDEWQYDREISLKGEAEPQFGRLQINKTLESYNATLGQMSCVFQVEWTEDGKSQSEVVSLTLDGAENSVILENLPVGVTVKVTEIYSGASYTSVGSTEAETVIVSDAAEGAPASVSFVNRYDGGNQGGYGVTNHFEVQEDGNWEWENPTAPPAE